MACEVPILIHRAPFGVHMVAPKAPADDLAGIDVGTPALAMHLIAVLPVIGKLDFNNTLRQCVL